MNLNPKHPPNTSRISLDVPERLHERFKANLAPGGMSTILRALLKALPLGEAKAKVNAGKPLKLEIRVL